MIKRSFAVVMVGVLAIAMATVAQAQLRGHGGPVRALAISPDGTLAISGSFDTSAIRWSLARNAAVEVLRFHEGAVNAVAYLPDGRVATAGEDGRIALWRPGEVTRISIRSQPSRRARRVCARATSTAWAHFGALM